MGPLNSLYTTFSFFSRTQTYLRRSRQSGQDIEHLKSQWALDTLRSFGVSMRLEGVPSADGPLILVGNHISYLDIPVLMWACPGLSFLAKSEIRNWPVVGQGAIVMGTTFVDRGKNVDRAVTRNQIAEALKAGKRIAVFPSGTTCMDESKIWKRGAFEIAKSLGIPVQPFRLNYWPIRTAAFIDQDLFPIHLFQLARHGGVHGTIEFHKPVPIADPEQASQDWQKWAQGRGGFAEKPADLS